MNTVNRRITILEPQSIADMSVGAFTVLDATEEEPISVGARVRIGHHALVCAGARLADDVAVDHYCLIGSKSSIGEQTQVLYGARVFESVTIGARCIIGGSVANWSVIGNDVTFMGVIAHTYRQPAPLSDWGTAPVPSPVIGDRAVIGEAALLIGGIEIGEGSYVAAGELVNCDVPPASLFMRGKITPLEKFRGFVRART